MKKHKVFVTGADGLLGSNVVRCLLNEQYQVTVLLQSGSESKTLDGLPIQRLYGDILDADSMTLAVKGHDILIHAAANTSVWPPKSQVVKDVNIIGTKNMVNAALLHSVKRFIHVGTANSFEKGSQESPSNELSPVGKESYGLDYIASKREAQEFVLSAISEQGLPAVIVNPTFLIGPYDSKPSSGDLLLSLFSQKVPAAPSGAKNYVAAKDAAVAIVNAIKFGEEGECYILGNHNYNYREAFDIICSEIGVSAPKYQLPGWLLIFYGRCNSFLARYFRFHPKVTRELAVISTEDHCYSGEKARKELNMPCTPLDVAVRESFSWLKNNDYV